MLTIGEDDEVPQDIEGHRKCLGECCLSAGELPIYSFSTDEKESDHGEIEFDSDKEDPASFLINLLLGQWEDRMKQGLFSYDVTACETKIIPGGYGFIAQLNEGCHLMKRPTEFRIDQVLQPFDKNKFNFTKIAQEEVLFRFEARNDDKTIFFPRLPVKWDSVSLNVVAINVSPIEYGHILLIPHVLQCLPQRIDHESFLLALHLAEDAADPFFRVGYNSLGAFATINHLHFQAYYIALPFAVEKAPTETIKEEFLDYNVSVSELVDYPIRGLVFEGGRNIRDLSVVVANACVSLQNRNIPFNILIVDCGKRVFLFPQCYAEKQALGQVRQELLDTQVNPGVWEINGHIVFKTRQHYENASQDYVVTLLATVSLPEKRFEEVKALVLDTAR